MSAEEIISIASSVGQKAQAAIDTITDLQDPPELRDSRQHLVQTEKTLETLRNKLDNNVDNSAVHLKPILPKLKLQEPLGTLGRICEEFRNSINGVSVLPENTGIVKFNTELEASARAFTSVCTVLSFILSCHASDSNLGDSFSTQEAQMSFTVDHIAHGQRNLGISHQQSQILDQLQELCKRSKDAATEAQVKQKFGQVFLQKSYAFQGIVGQPHRGVEQEFESIHGVDESRAIQGMADPASFAIFFSTGPKDSQNAQPCS